MAPGEPVLLAMSNRLSIHTSEDRRHAAELIQAKELVVFPTDTVYGIGAEVHSEAAIAALYAAKQRPLDKGLPVLLADASDVWQIAAGMSPLAQQLAEQYWPGPLTLIVSKRTDLPANLSPNDGVAVRVPDHDGTRAFIRLAGGAIASSSANIAAAPPARSADEADASLGGLVAAILDGGEVELGEPSTIVDCRAAEPVLVRQGPLALQLKDLATLR